jgi:hypothetical protein
MTTTETVTTANDIHQVLWYGSIVASDEDLNLLITFNGGVGELQRSGWTRPLTFNVWTERASATGTSRFQNVDVFTCGSVSYEEALGLAADYLEDCRQIALRESISLEGK